jgi:hypothetical protein
LWLKTGIRALSETRRITELMRKAKDDNRF